MFLFNLGECALLIKGTLRQLICVSLRVIHRHDGKTPRIRKRIDINCIIFKVNLLYMKVFFI